MAKLSKKQKLFVQEYLIDLNATQAAIRAGYSPRTACEQGSQLLAKLNIREEVGRAMADRSKRTGINQDRVILELARIAFVKMTDVVDAEGKIRGDAGDDDLACIESIKYRRSDTESSSSVEREVRIGSKLKALELLGRHLGMFRDRVELSGSLETEKTKLDELIRQMHDGV